MDREWLSVLAIAAACWTTGLLAGLLIAALAWSHLGG